MARKKTQEEFVAQLKEVAPHLTVLGKYIAIKSKVLVACPEGHEYLVSPYYALSVKRFGTICRVCTRKVPHNKRSSEDFVTILAHKAPNLKLLGVYTHCQSKVLVMDTTCLHEWEIIPNNLIARGNGTTCRVCTPVLSVLKKTHEQFVTELHLAAPELVLLDTYVCSHTAIRVQGVCKHIWPIIPNNIISASSGIVCRVCAPKQVSKGEVEMAEYVNAVLVNDRKILGGKELDIVLEDIKLALEYNGEYWHSDLYKSTTYHLDKLNACKEKGYQLIQIWEHEWQNKQDIVKSILNAKLGKALSVGARKCVIKEIPFPGDFLDDNHLQGRGSPTKINLGLFYKDILAAVMTFGTPRFTAQQDYELVRLCTLTGIVVQGGASKLFKYFRAKYKGSVLSYSDKRWGTGKVYEHLGFTYSHSSPPGYFYYNGSKKLSRYQCQKHKLQVLFPELFTHEKTEKEIMKEAGYYRCYDCGNDVYVIE